MTPGEFQLVLRGWLDANSRDGAKPEPPSAEDADRMKQARAEYERMKAAREAKS